MLASCAVASKSVAPYHVTHSPSQPFGLHVLPSSQDSSPILQHSWPHSNSSENKNAAFIFEVRLCGTCVRTTDLTVRLTGLALWRGRRRRGRERCVNRHLLDLRTADSLVGHGSHLRQEQKRASGQGQHSKKTTLCAGQPAAVHSLAGCRRRR